LTFQHLANHSEAQKRSRQREKLNSTFWLSAPESPTLLFCDEDKSVRKRKLEQIDLTFHIRQLSTIIASCWLLSFR
jgi:hypothetical protein